MFEREQRDCAFVPRWGIFRRIREQTTAEHMYFVALYASQFADLIEWKGDRGQLFGACIAHDMPENRSGDIPAPAKRRAVDGEALASLEEDYMQSYVPAMMRYYDDFNINPEIRAIVRVADMMEAVMYMGTETMLGNQYAGTIHERGSPCRDVYLSLLKAWRAMVELIRPDMDATQSVILFKREVLPPIYAGSMERPRILLANPDDDENAR